MRQLILLTAAIRFMTRLPMPAPRDFQLLWLPQSVRYFPLVGVLVGAINVFAWWLSSRWLPNTVSIGLMLAVSLLVTGAFHEDGFADACDGFGGGTTTDRVLAIMKDSRVGAYGAIGIGIMLGLKWTGLVAIPATALPVMVIGAHMVSRWCACGLIWRLRYVRAGEDGIAKPIAGGFGGRAWIASGALGVLAVLAVILAFRDALGGELLSAALAGRAACISLTAAMVTAVIAGVYFRQRIGGYTGDCLGAVQQLSELAFLLAGLGVIDSARSL